MLIVGIIALGVCMIMELSEIIFNITGVPFDHRPTVIFLRLVLLTFEILGAVGIATAAGWVG